MNIDSKTPEIDFFHSSKKIDWTLNFFFQSLFFSKYFFGPGLPEKQKNLRVQTVMNVQHGGFKFFVIFIVPWTILSDQKNF
jgi:hypothetical protein